MLSPTSFPKRLTTSRRFILCESEESAENVRGGSPHRLENKTKVSTMFKCPLQLDYMLLIIRIRLPQLVEDLYFFQSSTIPTT